MAIKHTFVSAKSDGADTSLVRPSDWNANHTIENDTVTFSMMQNIATDSLIGRDSASTGDPENILLNSTLEMDGSGNLRRAALTGDVTASAGSNSTTIANDAVTYAKMQNVSAASKLLGRGDSGSGDPQEITLGTGLSMSGTTLNASGGGGSWTLVSKSADQSRTSNTTPSADSELTCSLTAAKTYIIRGVILIGGTLNSGAQWNFNVTTAAPVRVTVSRYWLRPSDSTVSGTGIDTSVPTSAVGQTPGSSSFRTVVFFTAYIDTHATNAGTFSVQWAQNSSHATDATTVYKGSFFEYTSF